MTNSILLPNGIRVISRHFPEYSSVSIGVWVNTGSVNESAEESGLSHFVEHMVFRGTDRYDQYEITDRLDEVGGHINAFTTKEHTCFLAKVRSADIGCAIDVLSQLVTAPRFEAEHIALEKSVVLDEIAMYQDDPEDLVYEAAYRTAIAGYQPILGTPESVERFTREQIVAFYERYYCGSNLVVAIAGAFSERDLEDIAVRFGSIARGTPRIERPAIHKQGYVHEEKPLEQVQMLILFPTIGREDAGRYDLYALSHLFGSGHSSRLFKSLRGEHGLVYAVSTDLELYRDSGLFEISFSTTEDKLPQALEIIGSEIAQLLRDGVSEREVNAARSHMTGSTILSLDGSQRYMEFLGHSAVTGTTTDLDEILASIASIRTDRINERVRALFQQPPTIATIGGYDMETAAKYRALLLQHIHEHRR